jgi:signal transduction histidine kinase
MPTSRASTVRRYALSLAAIAAAVLLTLPMRAVHGAATPFFVLAVLVSAWFGGTGPAVLCGILAVVAEDFFFIEPIYSVELDVGDLVRAAALIIVLGIVVWFAHVRRRAERELREQSARLEEQARVLEAAKEELKRADRMKDDFLAVLSHELRNPLGAIRNGIYLLGEGAAKDPKRIHEMIDRQLKQLLRLMEDLLDVSRITRGKVVLRKELVELSSLVQDAIDLSRASIESKSHELTVTLPSGPVFLRGDRERLAQVLSNILGNAAKFTPHGGRIHLEATVEEDVLFLCVRDNGIGIPGDMVERVFEMFIQADHSASRSHAGLGIGLSLVRGLVEAHGGSVVARSGGPGQGSEILVRLPAVETGVPLPVGTAR